MQVVVWDIDTLNGVSSVNSGQARLYTGNQMLLKAATVIFEEELFQSFVFEALDHSESVLFHDMEHYNGVFLETQHLYLTTTDIQRLDSDGLLVIDL